jgi:hypothetical protein
MFAIGVLLFSLVFLCNLVLRFHSIWAAGLHLSPPKLSSAHEDAAQAATQKERNYGPCYQQWNEVAAKMALIQKIAEYADGAACPHDHHNEPNHQIGVGSLGHRYAPVSKHSTYLFSVRAVCFRPA